MFMVHCVHGMYAEKTEKDITFTRAMSMSLLLKDSAAVFSSHELSFHVGRQRNLPRENKVCMKHNLSVVGNESHFSFEY